jgi:hypothetical protein
MSLAPAKLNVVVPTPNAPVKKELAVPVAIKLPTVSCVPVAMSDSPSADDVMMELFAKNVLPVPPLATVFVNDDELERQVPEIA